MISYIGLMAYIGYYATQKTRTFSDYLTMSGKAGAILSGLAYFATQYSMSTFMGVPGTIYHVGYAGMSVSVPGIVFSMLIPALLVGRRLIRLGHKYGMLTMADYLSDRYESMGMRGFLAVIMIIFLVPMMGAQTIGGGIIFSTYTGAPEWLGIVIMGITVIAYCITGGIRSIMITDVIQGCLMVATAVVTFFAALKLGGGMELINQKLSSTNVGLMTHPGVNGGIEQFIDIFLVEEYKHMPQQADAGQLFLPFVLDVSGRSEEEIFARYHLVGHGIEHIAAQHRDEQVVALVERLFEYLFHRLAVVFGRGTTENQRQCQYGDNAQCNPFFHVGVKLNLSKIMLFVLKRPIRVLKKQVVALFSTLTVCGKKETRHDWRVSLRGMRCDTQRMFPCTSMPTFISRPLFSSSKR